MWQSFLNMRRAHASFLKQRTTTPKMMTTTTTTVKKRRTGEDSWSLDMWQVFILIYTLYGPYKVGRGSGSSGRPRQPNLFKAFVDCYLLHLDRLHNHLVWGRDLSRQYGGRHCLDSRDVYALPWLLSYRCFVKPIQGTFIERLLLNFLEIYNWKKEEAEGNNNNNNKVYLHCISSIFSKFTQSLLIVYCCWVFVFFCLQQNLKVIQIDHLQPRRHSVNVLTILEIYNKNV